MPDVERCPAGKHCKDIYCKLDHRQTNAEAEREVLNLLGSAFNAFSLLPEMHKADLDEFVHHIHGAQNIVLTRAGLRAQRKLDSEKPYTITTGRISADEPLSLLPDD